MISRPTFYSKIRVGKFWQNLQKFSRGLRPRHSQSLFYHYVHNMSIKIHFFSSEFQKIFHVSAIESVFFTAKMLMYKLKEWKKCSMIGNKSHLTEPKGIVQSESRYFKRLVCVHAEANQGRHFSQRFLKL